MRSSRIGSFRIRMHSHLLDGCCREECVSLLLTIVIHLHFIKLWLESLTVSIFIFWKGGEICWHPRYLQLAFKIFFAALNIIKFNMQTFPFCEESIYLCLSLLYFKLLAFFSALRFNKQVTAKDVRTCSWCKSVPELNLRKKAVQFPLMWHQNWMHCPLLLLNTFTSHFWCHWSSNLKRTILVPLFEYTKSWQLFCNGSLGFQCVFCLIG